MGGTSLSLTVFHGTGSGQGLSVHADGYSTSGTSEAKRTDVEGFVQMPISNRGAYWGLGARYISLDTDTVGTSRNATFPVLPVLSVSATSTTDIYLAEFGLGASAPLDSAGKHRFFGSLNLMVGYETSDFRTSVNGIPVPPTAKVALFAGNVHEKMIWMTPTTHDRSIASCLIEIEVYVRQNEQPVSR